MIATTGLQPSDLLLTLLVQEVRCGIADCQLNEDASVFERFLFTDPEVLV